MSRGRPMLGFLFGMVIGLSAMADDTELPDEDFLEFLGSWELDEDWEEFFDSLPDPADQPVVADESAESRGDGQNGEEW